MCSYSSLTYFYFFLFPLFSLLLHELCLSSIVIWNSYSCNSSSDFKFLKNTIQYILLKLINNNRSSFAHSLQKTINLKPFFFIHVSTYHFSSYRRKISNRLIIYTKIISTKFYYIILLHIPFNYSTFVTIITTVI